MKTTILTGVLLLVSNSAFGAEDCGLVKKDLRKAVDVPIYGLVDCAESNINDMTVLNGRYITRQTKRTGNHIPYKAFYKNNNLVKIEFFNDPTDVLYSSAIM